jgi:hypothetical protein
MAVKSLSIDGIVVDVEVDAADGAPALRERGPGDVAAVAGQVQDVGKSLRATISAVTRPIREALAEAQIDDWSVELSLGFKGEAGIPCITKGEANGSIKVVAHWKRPA